MALTVWLARICPVRVRGSVADFRADDASTTSAVDAFRDGWRERGRAGMTHHGKTDYRFIVNELGTNENM